jgi:hypothetical protein
MVACIIIIASLELNVNLFLIKTKAHRSELLGFSVARHSCPGLAIAY